MNLRALKFAGHQLPVQTELNADSSLAFTKSLSQDGPMAYVVSVQDLDMLRSFNDVIEDRRQRNKAKQLWGLLLGYEKIPIIDGNFWKAGSLINGV